jgi:hypothetical protein
MRQRQRSQSGSADLKYERLEGEADMPPEVRKGSAFPTSIYQFEGAMPLFISEA